jgi:hypothetical protein
MSKIFLYIDESKDYKNNAIHIGWFFCMHGLANMDRVCESLISTPYELKSTRKNDREQFEKIIQTHEKLPFRLFTLSFDNITSDKQYLDSLIHFLDCFIGEYKPWDLQIYADYIRLDEDMRRYEKRISKKLTHHFSFPITLEFLASHRHTSIQFADLAIWIHRRKWPQKNPAVYAS